MKGTCRRREAHGGQQPGPVGGRGFLTSHVVGDACLVFPGASNRTVDLSLKMDNGTTEQEGP